MERALDEKKIAEQRRAKVSQLCDTVRDDIKHWSYAFTRMKEWRKFARGLQWPGMSKADLSDPDRDYVANITLRHLKSRTAAIYAKNPSYQWRKTKRLTYRYWDGTAAQIQLAQELIQSGMDPTGMQQAIINDAVQSQAEAQSLTKAGETLTALYQHFVREQTPPAKKMMKKQVLSSLTCGVAYFKQTFQRATDYTPETSRAIADSLEQLKRLERLSADLQDGEADPHGPEAEELRIALQALEGQEQVILREGLAIDYPDSTNIIPDKNMTYLPGFIGCGHVTEQYCLTRDQIKEVYGKDIGEKYTAYKENETKPAEGGGTDTRRDTARIWEIWDRSENIVYTVCDGYEDYLEEPHTPLTYTERFYPWFVYAPNATDDADDPFPPSDVELMQSQQAEINRSGESLRDHRFAARPGWVAGANIPEADQQKIKARTAHSIVTLSSLKPDEDIRAKFQAFPTSPIDPNLYNTSPAFQDIQRSVGTQEANFGGTSGATATESTISESGRQSTNNSAIDEFDDLLSEMSQAGGQILLQEMSGEEVAKIVGRGAVWPEQSREDIAAEIHLEAVAGSSGRANQAQEVAIMERTFPLLFQLPGISHEKLTRHAVKILDDAAVYEDWLDTSALPVTALLGQMQASANQAGGGGNNAQKPAGAGATGMTGAGQAGMGVSSTIDPGASGEE